MAQPRKPQDHQKPAAQVESEGDETVTFTCGGHDYIIPAEVEGLDGEFLKYLADQDAYRMVMTALDAKQFARFKATKPKIRDYNAMSEKIAETYGFESAGN